MNGLSFDISNPLHNLSCAASSCFFGEPQYYFPTKDSRKKSTKIQVQMHTRGLIEEYLDAITPSEWYYDNTPAKLLEKAIDKALDWNPEATLTEAVRLRNKENIRTTPQVILVRAANHVKLKGTGLVRKYGTNIVKRADELSVCLAYQLQAYGKPIPNSLKKVLRDGLDRFTDCQLAKYRMENRTVKTVDVMNMVHPSRTDKIDKLAKGMLKTTGNTWESIRSNGGSWEDAIAVMGHMALLRNLRNFGKNEVNPDLYLDKLVNTTVGGKQLPFRYFSAYNALKEADFNNPRVLDAVENCLNISISNIPSIKGKTMSLCDNSGSAHGAMTSSAGTMTMATIGNLTGVITGIMADEGYVGTFGDRLEVTPIRKNSSVFDQLKTVNKTGRSVGAATENGVWLFWDKAIKTKEHWDNVFIYSDMQAGHGGLYGCNANEYSNYQWGGRHIHVPKLISEYRNKVNKNVNVFLVQTAGYQDTIVPEFYDRTYILGGWGDGILRFAATMIAANNR